MVNEIAVYINSLDEIADLNETGLIKVFSKYTDDWEVIRALPFKFHSTKEKEDIRLDTLNIAEVLGSCKIFVAKEFSDLAYTMLEGMGVSTWKMKGRPSEILDYILEKEKEEAEEIKIIDSANSNDKKQTVKPMEIGNNGYYILNVRELQDHNIGVTTKQALMPFLNEGNFNELILTCSHIPGWMESYLTKLNFNFQFSEVGEGDYLIIVNKK
ncbi:Fe-only nitrogenase accessory AnfO family protein [uncultured Clostridium sp.]|uniref:Fe-only nitrogenase accessory AnfO family protein n=1 Tax=uncultured Clostridium sp. TaxID=59620 RepID=UPI0028E2E108|nr:Fe-only nitrogenase accessory AnfO family protein [uncultured Clostridium sp.]